ncbi:MAG: KilA-N domain-containing protein [Candidatus Desulfofervidaceae bacterium]|nr:KilA-N domain-containing protein [Candidatus Desulfofervidaceae bacterium]
MATKYEIVEIDNKEITVDVSLLRKTREMYFNATNMAKPFGKKVNDFLRLESTKEYIEVIINEGKIKGENSRLLTYESLVRIKKGRNGGTYLHNELAFEFAGWLSPIFRRNLHKWAQERIEQERDWKKKRLEAKTGYLPMTEAIMKVHSDPKFYHYSNEADMINHIVLGCTAKQYKERNNVDSVRECVSAAELAHIERLQQTNTGLIECGMPYEERKELLTKLYNKRLLME